MSYTPDPVRYALPVPACRCCFFNTALWNNADDTADKTQIEYPLYTKKAFYASTLTISGIYEPFHRLCSFFAPAGNNGLICLKYFPDKGDKLAMIGILPGHKIY